MKSKRLESLSIVVTFALVAVCLFGTQMRSHAKVWLDTTPAFPWKYYQAGDEPANDASGDNWKELTYNDSTWASGPAPLGFRNGIEMTELTKGPITFYFRQTIVIEPSDLDIYNQLVTSLLRDDGAVIYVNGTEIRRDNMAGSAGDPVAYETEAEQGVAGSDEKEYFPKNHLTSTAFVPGANTIAVEVHQASPNSSDVGFSLKLEVFTVIPVLGNYVPPAPIDFNDEISFSGDYYWDPDKDAFPGDPFNIGWYAKRSSGSSQVHFAVPFLGQPADGFTHGNCMLTTRGSVTMVTDVTTIAPGNGDERHPVQFRLANGSEEDMEEAAGAYRIDLSNFRDVKLRFDMRAYDDTSAGMGTASSAKAYLYTSVDGADFDETEILNIAGKNENSETSDVLVADADGKHVLVPASDIGDSWQLVGFNTASWIAGTKGTGYERSSSNTYDKFFGPTLDLEAELYQKNPSLYMRIPFTVDDPSVYIGLDLEMLYDDGFVAYINGHEVESRNQPSPLAWNSQAEDTHSDTLAVIWQRFDIFEDHLDKLVPGDNVLAIHGLNKPNSSSDMLIAAQLIGKKSGNIGGIGEPEFLDDIGGPLDGPFHTFVRDIPDSAQTVTMKWVMNCNKGNNCIMLDNIMVSGTPIKEDSYPTWIQITTPYELDDLGLPTADPDGDLVKNVLDYAFGGSATEPDAFITPTMEIIEIGVERYVAMSWRQLNETATGPSVVTDQGVQNGAYQVRDVTYIPQISGGSFGHPDPFVNDDGDWIGGGNATASWIFIDENNEEITELPEGEDGDRTVTIRAYYKNAIEDTDDKLFGRVRVLLEQQ